MRPTPPPPQVKDQRTRYGVELAFMLMNSFATSADTLSYLSKYEGLAKEGMPLEFCQNKAPKVTCLLYTSPSPRDRQKSRMPSSA